MADLMVEFKDALSDLAGKKKVFDEASVAVTKAAENYEAAKTNVIKLRVAVDKSLDDALSGVGVSATDSRVTQSN